MKSALISDPKRVFSNQRLNKTQGADRATVQRLVYKSQQKGYKLQHFDNCWKYKSEKPLNMSRQKTQCCLM